MRRFFSEDLVEGTTTLRLKGEEFVHLKKVLRLGQGQTVAVFNGRGAAASARIERAGKDFADLTVLERLAPAGESPLELVLAQGLLKGDKPELIIQKATELGVKEICFYTTARTVPIAGELRPNRAERWKKASIEAAKQCGRAVLPRIPATTDYKTVLSAHEGYLKLFFYEGGGQKAGKALEGARAGKGVVALVGPEGGLSDDEARQAVEAGFIPVSLGPRILRAETAAISAATLIQNFFGDMG